MLHFENFFFFFLLPVGRTSDIYRTRIKNGFTWGICTRFCIDPRHFTGDERKRNRRRSSRPSSFCFPTERCLIVLFKFFSPLYLFILFLFSLSLSHLFLTKMTHLFFSRDIPRSLLSLVLALCLSLVLSLYLSLVLALYLSLFLALSPVLLRVPFRNKSGQISSRTDKLETVLGGKTCAIRTVWSLPHRYSRIGVRVIVRSIACVDYVASDTCGRLRESEVCIRKSRDWSIWQMSI